MLSVLDPAYRRSLIERLGVIDAEASPEWGTMTAGAMVCHLADQLRGAMGDLHVASRETWLRRTLGRWFLLRTSLPVPKGRPTAAEMLTTEPGNFREDRREFVRLLERFTSWEGPLDPHPMLGRLSHSEWAILVARHVDHHLRQFGA